MTKTLTEVEVKKTATANHATHKSAPARQKQHWRTSKLFWIVAPISLLATGSAAFLAVRRWQNSSASRRGERQA